MTATGGRLSLCFKRTTGSEATPCTFANESRSRKSSFGKGTSWRLITGRLSAANPRSARQTSPGRDLIEHVQHFLLTGSQAHDVEDIFIGEFDHLGNALPNLCRSLHFPSPQFRIQLFREWIYFRNPSLTLPRK